MINSMAIRDFWDFEHYGCWCIEKKGYGPAVDEVDFACLGIYRFYCVLRLQQCWRCMLSTKYVGDKFEMLVTFSNVLVKFTI